MLLRKAIAVPSWRSLGLEIMTTCGGGGAGGGEYTRERKFSGWRRRRLPSFLASGREKKKKKKALCVCAAYSLGPEVSVVVHRLCYYH